MTLRRVRLGSDTWGAVRLALEQIQDAVAAALVSRPQVLVGVELEPGENVISHKLGRKLTRWRFVRQDSPGQAYEVESTSPHLTLILFASAAFTADIEVE